MKFLSLYAPLFYENFIVNMFRCTSYRGPSDETIKTEVPYTSMCDMIKNSHCMMAISAKHTYGSKFGPFHL